MNYGIGNVKGKSKALFTTTTAPTISGGVITLATTDIVESGFKVGDYLAYVDSDNISALYSISAISSGTATLSLIGNIGGGGGGKQLYQHCINIVNTAMNATFTIINDNDTPLTTLGSIRNWLLSKGFTTQKYQCSGVLWNSTHDNCTIFAVRPYTSIEADRLLFYYSYSVASQTELKTTSYELRDTHTPTITDTVIPL